MKITLEYSCKNKSLHKSENIDFKMNIGDFIENIELRNESCSGAFIVCDILYYKIDGVYECTILCEEIDPNNVYSERVKILKDSGHI